MKISYYQIIKRKNSYYTKKMDENFRFIAILDEFKRQGLVKDYVMAAEALGTNKTAISDIKAGRKKLSIALLRSMKISYPKINLYWVVTGVGDMFIDEAQSTSGVEGMELFVERITTQAEEIGRLKAELAETKKHAERLAALVDTDASARVG